MTSAQKTSLAHQFNYACGYCGTTETEAGAKLTVDHFQPTSQGGADASQNWVYCCFACNGHKHDYWSQDEGFALLHPQQDDFSPHWQQRDDGLLAPLTERGRVHIEILHLNRPQLVAKRRQRQQIDTERLRTRTLEIERNNLEAQIAQLTREMFGEQL